MKTYYYSIRENNKNWDQQKQYRCVANVRADFINLCYALSYHFKTEIRGCESEGYNNQGIYIYNNSNLLNNLDYQH
jgi:hypothetical protein